MSKSDIKLTLSGLNNVKFIEQHCLIAAQHRKGTSNLANFKGNVCEDYLKGFINRQLYGYIIFKVKMLSKY